MIRYWKTIVWAVLLFGSGCDLDPTMFSSEIPETPMVSIEPAEPGTMDMLSVVVETFTEINLTVNYDIQWYQNDTLRTDLHNSTFVPSSMTSKEDSWDVEVQGLAVNGEVTDVVSAGVIIKNRNPQIRASIIPKSPNTGDFLLLDLSYGDPDGDPVTTQIVWQRNGALESEFLDQIIVDASYTANGDVWTVTASATDSDNGASESVVSVLVGNQVPVVSGVSIDPSVPTEADVLGAVLDVYEPDNDPLVLQYDWYINGALLDIDNNSQLTGEVFNKGDEIWVEVAVSDGWIEPEWVISDSVTVQNTVPSILSAFIDPPNGTEDDVFGCMGVGWSDPDPADPELYYVE